MSFSAVDKSIGFGSYARRLLLGALPAQVMRQGSSSSSSSVSSSGTLIACGQAFDQLTTKLQQQADVTQRNWRLTADSFTSDKMKSGGLLWTAAMMMMMMVWLAIVADAYYLSDKQVSDLLLCFMLVTFCDCFVRQTIASMTRKIIS